MRRRYAVAVAGCVAALLSACGGGLATSSPIRPGLDVGSVQENEVRVEANPIAPGSSPEQVVSGFIRAAAASDDSYQVARSYLTSGPAASWRPDTSVVIFSNDSELRVKQTGAGTVTATATATARVDGNGRYQELPANSTDEVTFGMERTAGEWRITALPDQFGTWLSESDFDRLYDSYRIYFLSTTQRRLVPDVRWFPLGTGLATRLARSLIAGVPDYLRGAVRSDVPTGTRLAVDSVTIDSGTATVDLTATQLATEPAQRQNLAAQFLATVSQAPGVSQVALQLEGAGLQVPGIDGALRSLSALGFATPSDPSAKPVLRIGSTLVSVDPDEVGDPGERPRPPGTATALPSLQPGWAYPALSADGREVAAVGGDRSQLARWRGKTQVQLLTFGSLLTRPTYDQDGILWVAGRDKGATRVWALDARGDQAVTGKATLQAVAVSWLADRRVVSVRVSPDGQRVAVVSTAADGNGPRVDVAGVVRGTNDMPVSLAPPLTLAPTLTLVRDVVWVDDATLVALGRKNSGQVIRPWTVPLGGQVAAGPEIAGALTITTINGERGLIVTTEGGQVLIRAGSRWQPVGEGSDLLVPAR